jgi:hypothetical protein
MSWNLGVGNRSDALSKSEGMSMASFKEMNKLRLIDLLSGPRVHNENLMQDDVLHAIPSSFGQRRGVNEQTRALGNELRRNAFRDSSESTKVQMKLWNRMLFLKKFP